MAKYKKIGMLAGYRLNGRTYDASGKEVKEIHEEDCFCCRKNVLRMAGCIDCGLDYGKMGLDLVMPDQQWKLICPENGILCANCICKRAEKFGGTSIVCWISNFQYKPKNRKEK